MKELAKSLFRKYLDRDVKRRTKIIKHFNINKLLDVGANTGIYGLRMRNLRYKHQLISFEPLNDAFAELKKVSSKDKNWIAFNYALGDADMKSTINISGNSVSSSILKMLPSHTTFAPESDYISTQEIEVKKLDTIFNEFYEKGDRIMLKIDTQGYEKNVIDGSRESLKEIAILQVEMSIISLYENELLLPEMITYLNKLGFELYSIETGFYDRSTGRLLQVDGLFVNRNLI